MFPHITLDPSIIDYFCIFRVRHVYKLQNTAKWKDWIPREILKTVGVLAKMRTRYMATAVTLDNGRWTRMARHQGHTRKIEYTQEKFARHKNTRVKLPLHVKWIQFRYDDILPTFRYDNRGSEKWRITPLSIYRAILRSYFNIIFETYQDPYV